MLAAFADNASTNALQVVVRPEIQEERRQTWEVMFSRLDGFDRGLDLLDWTRQRLFLQGRLIGALRTLKSPSGSAWA